ncbi:chordin-like protein 1 [Paramacrobiotus metropolitanus]|uniref:chordin-like protein 1 n=1 Tax=Paramacrobiotus metropolitanus TaxID=2943436 RepID=UPI00244597BD|nr:chordin-like protein 1 [Paramacrobiotus metropolitanus]
MLTLWSGAILFVILGSFVGALPLNDSCEFHSGKKLIYPVGATWEIRVGSYKDFQCLDCSCLPHSTVRCVPSRKTCPTLDNCLKIEQVPDSCCPKCTEVSNEPEPEPAADVNRQSSITERRSVDECYHAGAVYDNGQRWSPHSNTTAIRPMDADNQCIQCYCQDGQTMCYLKTCPVLSCDTVFAADNCCPVCAESNQSTEDAESTAEPGNDYERYAEVPDDGNIECVSGSERYEDGSQWHPVIPPFGRMKCVLCECDNGQIKCKKVTCPDKPTCANPITKPGFCCPICPTETNEIANVSASGPYVCLKHRDYLVYEYLHGTTMEIAMRLPEEEMMWISTWNVNAYQDTNVSSIELKIWEFRRSKPLENYKFLGIAKSKRANRFFRRLNKIRHTCRHRCSKRMERLIQMLRIQAVYTGSKSNCPDSHRPVDTRL